MINKVGAAIYLRQPFRYSSNYFTGIGPVGFGLNAKLNNEVINYDNVEKTATRTIQSTNYKSKITGSFSTGETAFINCLFTGHGGVSIDNLHIGRVFNRAALPTGTDCFFSSGNMGSSNGTITPTVPVEWTPEGIEEWAKGDVFVIQIHNTGGVGTAKFRYCSYPYLGFSLGTMGYGDRWATPKKFGYSETVVLYKLTGQYKAITNGGDYTFNAIWAESRTVSYEETVNIALSDPSTIRFYTDPSFTLVDREITPTLSGSPVQLTQITYADGAIYGLGDDSVYTIDTVSGTATEISGASMSGTNQLLLATHDQTRVYYFADGNCKIINTSDDTVTTPTNTVPSDINGDSILVDFGIDIDNNIWYKTKKYDKDDLSDMGINLTRNDTYAQYYSVYGLNGIITGSQRVYIYDLEGKAVCYSDYYFAGVQNSSGYRNVLGGKIHLYDNTTRKVHLSLPAEDIIKQQFRDSKKDWKIFDGTSWIKGWTKETKNNALFFTSETILTDDEIWVELSTGVMHSGGSIKISSLARDLGHTWAYTIFSFKFINENTLEETVVSTGQLHNMDWDEDPFVLSETLAAGTYTIEVQCNHETNGEEAQVRNVKIWSEGIKTYSLDYMPADILENSLEISNSSGTLILEDDGSGNVLETGTANVIGSVDYTSGDITIDHSLITDISFFGDSIFYAELTSEAVTGTDIALQDGVVVDFEDGVEAPHFVEGDYFSFTVAEGHIVDNLEAYSASVDLYVVPYHDVSDETFTISATAMDVAATVNTGFIKVESDIGLTGTIAGSEATIITSGDPTAGQIKIDYDSGALTFHVDDVGSTAVISYRWLERPE